MIVHNLRFHAGFRKIAVLRVYPDRGQTNLLTGSLLVLYYLVRRFIDN
jgi:hypothetical protein